MKFQIGPNDAGQTVQKYVKKLMRDVPLSAIHKAFRKGDVRLNEQKADPKDRLNEGDALEIRYLDSRKAETPKEFIQASADFKIIYEDDSLLFIEKWPGVLVHPDGADAPSLTDYVLSYLAEKGDYNPADETTFSPSPLNRLDRNTSGIVIFGKSAQGTREFAALQQQGGLKKEYTALIKGRLADGIHEAYIEKEEDRNLSKIYEEPGPGRRRIAMASQTLTSNGIYSLVELDLMTGRSHQLRAHLARLGNPIVGDRKYGDKAINAYFDNKFGLKFQFLYAYKVTFGPTEGTLSPLSGRTIAVKLPPLFRKIRNEVFRVDL